MIRYLHDNIEQSISRDSLISTVYVRVLGSKCLLILKKSDGHSPELDTRPVIMGKTQSIYRR